ncbi:hypothetical protein EJ02DRAFT_120903 [Clathrospora elynae]|uniref:Uncharacterized protein n=1 Tax=Clathrospora elynae TaxID=706981 RepID=A0A6A5SSX2_9PLEO|nr:hypothetical protein EJ02DRAFT_120903 [Clathrospora elynae]
MVCVHMPSIPRSSDSASIPSWATLISPKDSLKAVLLLSALATAVRLIGVLVAQRKKRMTRSSKGRENSCTKQKGGLPIHQKKDSSMDRKSPPNHERERPVYQKLDISKARGKDSTDQGNGNDSNRPSLDQEPNHYLRSLEQETLQPSFGPVYPWIAPPQSLPGPYDAPYYPLPLPTITHFSEEPATIKCEQEEERSNVTPKELESTSYTRRVSANSNPSRESSIEGSTTIPTKGRRPTHAMEGIYRLN